MAHRPGPDDVLAAATVLVVDDQPANVILLERLLARVGVGKVVGITDPRLAVDQYRTLQPDLILLDLHMPHLDGLAVLDALASVVPDESFVPVLVLSADVTDDSKRAALAAGAKDFLTKPFDQTEVILRVKNLLETRALYVALQCHNAALEAELAEQAERERRLAHEHEERQRRIRGVLDTSAITMVFQPIVALEGGAVVGAEALSRFPDPEGRPPNEWFAEAARVGLGAELELLAVRAALAQLDQLPPTAYVAVNVSPATVLHPELAAIVTGHDSRVVVELTEHIAVETYDRLLDALRALRALGVRVAVDDAGSGYASLQHILRISPDIIKLDIGLTRDIDADPARRALAVSLVSFAKETGAAIVAEGIETAEEFDTLRRIGVAYGQGYHIARPGPLPLVGRAVNDRLVAVSAP